MQSCATVKASLVLVLLFAISALQNVDASPQKFRATNVSGGQYEIIRDEIVFSRWRSITSRLVRMPNGNEVDYDVSIGVLS